LNHTTTSDNCALFPDRYLSVPIFSCPIVLIVILAAFIEIFRLRLVIEIFIFAGVAV